MLEMDAMIATLEFVARSDWVTILPSVISVNDTSRGELVRLTDRRTRTTRGFERVFIPSAPGDAGCALGAALWADRIGFGQPDPAVPDHPYWGPAVDEAGAGAGRGRGWPVDPPVRGSGPAGRTGGGAPGQRPHRGMDAGRVRIRSEGPRESEHPCRPSPVEMRDRVNQSIKYREEFRPFAPAVPLEAADRFFELPPGGARLARTMSGVFPVRPAFREQLAAVTHVDGTARVQAVPREMAPLFHALLQAYGARTGVPVLLNTSFNLAGEPIVNRATEGYSTFRRCGIDVLVAGQCLVSKAQPRGRARRSHDQETRKDAAGDGRLRERHPLDR